MSITLRAARVNAGLTREEAAKAAGVTKSTIHRWENDEAFPNLPKLKALCDLYDISVDDVKILSKQFAKCEEN